MGDFTRIDGCRGCGSADLETVMSFGPMPLADALLTDLSEAANEERYPQTVVFCRRCSLVQLVETVAPEILYGDSYPYYSSFSDHLVDHARRNVEGLIERSGLGAGSLVIEIASNDGYLLQWFRRAGIPVLGIDPAEGPAEAAVTRGIPTICDYFDPELADRLRREGTVADLIIGNNVLAHVPDQNRLVAAMKKVLRPGGSIVMEFPYVRDLVEKSEFDTIYHEHHCYFSLRSVERLFANHDLRLLHAERLSIHGGSLRVHFGTDGEPTADVASLRDEEDRLGMDEFTFYRGLDEQARRIRRDLVTLLDERVANGERIAAYAAAAKGAVLLNYCGIGPERIDYVVDRNVHKQGHFMPGVHLPIRSPEVLSEDRPDLLLILAWNFADEIIEQQQGYSAAGGRFIVPVPEPRTLARAAP